MSWRKLGLSIATFGTLSINPAASQISDDRALLIAVNFARTCYVDMVDAQIKCGGRPQRTFSSAKALLSPGRLVKGDEPSPCKISKPIWVFQWRAFPEKAPVIVDGRAGKLLDVDRGC